jgi:16S rRNA (guanine1516-N2)-methyltransferase
MHIAAQLQGQWVPRGKLSMSGLRRKYAEASVLLVTREEIRYYVEELAPIFFHPSMAAVRIKRLQRGEKDAMIELSGAHIGDSVLDCTAGLASDSIVFSFAVGSEGQVIALESEAVLAYIIEQGLSLYESDNPGLNEAMRRVRVVQLDHLAYLRGLKPRSVDVVYFDPMFRQPIQESNSISPLRSVANPGALTLEAIEQARRVARKSIILKEHKDSAEFERLGFDTVLRSNTKTTYGVIRL